MRNVSSRTFSQHLAALVGVGLLILTINTNTRAAAQTTDQQDPLDDGQIVYFSHASRGWAHVPTVVVSGAVDDPRAPLVARAVQFWNAQLEQMGSSFRLGLVSYTATIVPVDFLEQRSLAVLGQTGLAEVPNSLDSMPGDIVVALSEGNFVSFTTGVSTSLGRKIVVGIRHDQSFPLTLPNVALNVITHELGHAIGLGHNNDPTKLMCGRPAPCRPTAFESDDPHIFPITDTEVGFLLQLYPPDWAPAS